MDCNQILTLRGRDHLLRDILEFITADTSRHTKTNFKAKPNSVRAYIHTGKVKQNYAKYKYLFRVGMNAYQAANLVKPALSGAFFPVKKVYFVAEDIEWGHTLVEGVIQLGMVGKDQVIVVDPGEGPEC